MSRDETRARFQADPTDPRHGTTNGYGNLRCRCPRCREANARAHLDYMHGDDGTRLRSHAARQRAHNHGR